VPRIRADYKRWTTKTIEYRGSAQIIHSGSWLPVIGVLMGPAKLVNARRCGCI